jgi:hypothetical protein
MLPRAALRCALRLQGRLDTPASLRCATADAAVNASAAPPPDGRPRVVVLGSGWAAFALVRALDRKRFAVAIVSPRNHMLFTPLLASTAVGTPAAARAAAVRATC